MKNYMSRDLTVHNLSCRYKKGDFKRFQTILLLFNFHFLYNLLYKYVFSRPYIK